LLAIVVSIFPSIAKAGLILDTFDTTDQLLTNDTDAPVSDSTAAPEAIGGSRFVGLFNSGEPVSDFSVVVMGPSYGSVLQYRGANGTSGGAFELAYNVASIDITEDGKNSLFEIESLAGGPSSGSVQMRLLDANGVIAQSLFIPLIDDLVRVRFSNFFSTSIDDIDLTNIDLINLAFVFPRVTQYSIGAIAIKSDRVAVSAPRSYALLVIGLFLLLIRRERCFRSLGPHADGTWLCGPRLSAQCKKSGVTIA
jgi:hypothetical protein